MEILSIYIGQRGMIITTVADKRDHFTLKYLVHCFRLFSVLVTCSIFLSLLEQDGNLRKNRYIANTRTRPNNPLYWKSQSNMK